MKRIAPLTIMIILAMSFSAHALSITTVSYDGSDYDGTYMFTVIPDPPTTTPTSDPALSWLQSQINTWFSANESGYQIDSLTYYDKYEFDEGTSENGLLSITGGTWYAPVPVEFYAVKGSTSYAMYWLGFDGASSAQWTTGHLVGAADQDSVGISHLTGYNPTSAPVPEPATLLLLGSGLLGLLGISRKKFKK